MKAEKMIRAIGNVDDRYLLEAQERPAKRSPWKTVALAAACFVVIGAVCLGVFALPNLFTAKNAATADAVSAAQPVAAAEEANGAEIVYDETLDGTNYGEPPMMTEGANNAGAEKSAEPRSSSAAASLSELSATEQGADATSGAIDVPTENDVPPGESVATLEKIEKIGEHQWRLSLSDSQGEPYGLEVSDEIFAMPPTSLEEGATLVILYGEGYEPVQILYYGVAYYGE